MTTQSLDYENMSDEELLKAPPPVIVEQQQQEQTQVTQEQQENNGPSEEELAEQQRQAEAQAVAEKAEQEAAAAKAASDAAAQAAAATVDENGQQVNNAGKQGEVTEENPANLKGQQADEAAKAKTEQEQSQEAKAAAEAVSSSGSTAVTAEETLKKIMAPLKANGKEIQLKDPDEVIRLMQMGADYTRKMQQMAPHRKVLMMLENNGLLDESKLSFLIDLEKKNPEAIKKLLKDGGIDPLSIDTTTDPAYTGGNHRVSDSDVAFQTVLDTVLAQPMGQETINDIHTNWDQASKQELGKDPTLLETFRQQRASGVYDIITTEMERQKVLNPSLTSVPFVQLYNQVGHQLVQQKGGGAAAQTPAAAAAQPVATRVHAPKPVVTNGDKAAAASTNRTVAKAAQTQVNYLAMSDEEFLKSASIINR